MFANVSESKRVLTSDQAIFFLEGGGGGGGGPPPPTQKKKKKNARSQVKRVLDSGFFDSGTWIPGTNYF